MCSKMPSRPNPTADPPGLTFQWAGVTHTLAENQQWKLKSTVPHEFAYETDVNFAIFFTPHGETWSSSVRSCIDEGEGL
jgi:hypothetical protein